MAHRYRDEDHPQEGSRHFNSFSGAHDFQIGEQFNLSHNSSVNVTNHHYYGSGGSLSLIERLDPVQDASFIRNRRTSPPNSICLPGTRDRVIEQIRSWADGGMLFKGSPSQVMWVKGALGTGKSALAQTIADMFAKKGRLAASFFFFCQSEERSSSSRLARTLASQLSGTIPSTKPLVEKALDQHVGLLKTSSMPLQFQYLFLDPFRAAFSKTGLLAQHLLNGPYITVIDGLDECEDRRQVAEFLQEMLKYLSEYPRTPLRFFISSTPVQHIRAPIEQSQVEVVDLDQPASERELTFLVLETLKNAERVGKVPRLKPGWPTQDQMKRLINRAKGSLGVLTTILRYIVDASHDGQSPQDRLFYFLDLPNRPTEACIDEVYKRIVKFSQHRPGSHAVISTLALSERSLTATEIARFRQVEGEHVDGVLNDLRAVLDVPEDSHSPISFASSPVPFREYILSTKRSGEFSVSPSDHSFMAHRCLDILGTDSGVEPLADYARKYCFSHWTSLVKAYNGSADALARELGHFVARTREEYPDDYLRLLSFYSCLCHEWIASARAVAIGELLSSVLMTRRAQVIRPLTKMLDVLMKQFPLSSDHALPTLWPRIELDPPLPDLPTSTYSRILERCTAHLFQDRRWVGLPVSLRLPVKQPLNHHYAFGAWCWHLAMAAKYDPTFNRESLLAQHPENFRNGTITKLQDPVTYLNNVQIMLEYSGDYGAIIRTLKYNVGIATSTIEALLAPETIDSYASIHDWDFVYENTSECVNWVYGSRKEDTSILNMFVGLKALTECFIARLEGTHDPGDGKCIMHVQLQTAMKRIGHM